MRLNQLSVGKGKHKLFALPLLWLISMGLSAQQTITGVVTGENAQPLYGVNVFNQESGKGAITSPEGAFSISAKPGDLLEFSFVGYTDKQVKISTETALSVALSVQIINLDDIVVTGYVSQRVKEITGAVAVVKVKDLTSIPAGQVEQMLQGKVAGLNVITSGMPGGASNVRLHGIGNFGDVTPLYIIDGVQGNINSLNPDDISSIQVLKDAGAYSIYGVRGANGVIVVTTRSGKPGKTKISYDSYISTTRPLKGPDLLNPQESADLAWLAYKNSGQPPYDPLYGNGATPVLPDYFIAGYNQGLTANDPDTDPSLNNVDFNKGPLYQIIQANKSGTDWFHEIFKPAFSQNHTLTVSGSNDKNKYLFSLGYLNQQGTAINTFLKRYTARLNTEFSVNNNVRIGETLQLSYRENPQIATQQGPNANEIFNAITTPPLLPVYDIKGNWAHFAPANFNENPVAMRTLSKDDKGNFWEILGNAYAEADLLKFFTIRTSFGGSQVNYNSYNFSATTYLPRPDNLPNNSLTESSGYRRSWTWTNTLSFARSFNTVHNVKLLIGTEAISNYNREVGGKSFGFFTNSVNFRFLGNGNISDESNYSFASTSTLYSLLSRAEYGYKEKYILTGTVRRDGSSVFDPQRRYGWFPMISAAWRMTEENFLKQLSWLTDLKLRASWGKTGYYGNTDPFNQYTLYGGTISSAYYDIYGTNNPVQGFRTVRLGDPKTGWQEDIVTNIGFESVFLNGKFNATIDWYRKKSNGVLFPITLPDILGGAIPPNVNIASIQNTGVDILLGSKGKLSKDWHWDVTVTVSVYKNKITRITDLPYFYPPFQIAGPFVKNEVGHPTGLFYGYQVIGLFKDDNEVNKAPLQDAARPGRFRYLDANGDNSITDADRVYIGNPNPRFTAGMTIGFSYKNVDLSTFFYGSFGNDVVNATKFATDFFATGNSAKSKALLYDSWTPQHTDARIPIVENDYNFSNADPINSYVVEDGSYCRNKSVILGYTFSKPLLKKIKINTWRIYAQALNLFTVTDYSGLDPELSGHSSAFGIDFGNYPNNQRQYVLGLSATF